MVDDYPEEVIPIKINKIWGSEVDREFLQHMANSMGMSFYKYGKLIDAYPHKIDALDSLAKRIQMYQKTGNKEYLVDAANFAMIEFMHPNNPNAHFEPKDSHESPGRKFHYERDFSKRGNKEI